jgi:hypothetical protein
MLKSLLMAVFLWVAQNPGPAVTGATAGGSAPPPSCPSIPTPAPVSFWSLAGDTTAISGCVPTSSTTVYDSAGGGNSGIIHGTLGGGVAGTAYSAASGRTSIPYAMYFDGSTDYVDTGAATSFNGSDLASSAFAWIKISAALGSGSVVIQNNGSPFLNAARILGLYTSSGTSVVTFSNYGYNSNMTLPVSVGTWHFVGYTYATGASQITLYLDGVGQTNTVSGRLGTSGSVSYIGQLVAGGLFFPGLINDLGCWNSELTSAQVSSIYAAQAFNVIPELRPLNRPVWAYGATEERLMFYRRRLAA